MRGLPASGDYRRDLTLHTEVMKRIGPPKTIANRQKAVRMLIVTGHHDHPGVFFSSYVNHGIEFFNSNSIGLL